MLLKVFLFIVLIYFVLKTTTRLIHAMKNGGEPSHVDGNRSTDWSGNGTRQSYEDEDVEDAKFVDVS